MHTMIFIKVVTRTSESTIARVKWVREYPNTHIVTKEHAIIVLGLPIKIEDMHFDFKSNKQILYLEGISALDDAQIPEMLTKDGWTRIDTEIT